MHTSTAVSRRVDSPDEAVATLARLRDAPPERLAGIAVTVADLSQLPGRDHADALVLAGGDI